MIAAGTPFDLTPCAWTKTPTRERTSRRVRSAERAVERDRAACPLFPETARFASAVERLDAADVATRAWHRGFRSLYARNVRTARALLAPLHPDHRAALADEWHARRGPREPAYLLDWLVPRLDGRRRRPAPILRRSDRAVAAMHLDRAATARRSGARLDAHHALAVVRSIQPVPLP